MRIAAIAIATIAVAGCANETLLRIVLPSAGVTPPPASLRVTLVGDGVTAPPRTIAPVSFPGTIVVRGLSAGALCVQVDAFDAYGTLLVGGVANVQIVAHRTNVATLHLAGEMQSCATPIADMSAPAIDMSDTGDMTDAGDMTPIATCPASATFCDDFESDNLTRWSGQAIKFPDMGAITRETIRAAHGHFSVEVTGGGTAANANYVTLYKTMTITPPFAMRANLWTAAPLGSYTVVMLLNDATTHGFAVGGDGNNTWVVSEDQSGAPDRHSDMVPAGGGGWHCVELVLDDTGNVTFFVDGNLLIGPWARATATSYTYVAFGLARTAVADSDVFIDDVAVGPTRLYCP